ncbi:hypothetical protein JKP88DRAFT_264198 [Tribonema minus]|uniref:SH2 domain-containing protein n=1 Tax=Tribonema minus TaxID=303371 RepID=A0A835YQQ8_9STRA|nr:hypothetical protein JKP88DRAFT_264198 [Tribonema minus]
MTAKCVYDTALQQPAARSRKKPAQPHGRTRDALHRRSILSFMTTVREHGRRLLDKPFREAYRPTRAFDVAYLPHGHHNGAPVLVELWDVAGAQLSAVPSHHALIAMGAAAALVVVDAASAPSLAAADAWNGALAEHLPPRAVKMLVAHKNGALAEHLPPRAAKMLVAHKHMSTTTHICPAVKMLGVHKVDLPRCVVDKAAMDAYAAAAGFRAGWCCTVGAPQFGDYSVRGSERRRAVTAKQLTVQEALRRVVDTALRAREEGAQSGGGGAAAEQAPVLESTLRERGALDDLLWSGCCADGAAAMAHVARQRHFRAADVLRRCSVQGISSDAGWGCFAGSIDRETADAMLAAEPVGTYLLRRRTPRQLVLCIASGDAAAKGAQHVLINYEQGHYTDQQGRLGRFPTLEELLQSKVAQLATRPLRFRRVHGSGRYDRVTDDIDERSGSGGGGSGGGGGGGEAEHGSSGRPPEWPSVRTLHIMHAPEDRLKAASKAAEELLQSTAKRLREARERCPQCLPVTRRLEALLRGQQMDWDAQLEESAALTTTSPVKSPDSGGRAAGCERELEQLERRTQGLRTQWSEVAAHLDLCCS